MSKDKADLAQALSASFRAGSAPQRGAKKQKRSPIKAVVRIAVGLVFGLVTTMALTPAVAAFHDAEKGGAVPAIFMAFVIIGTAAITYYAPSIRRAFGRGFLVAGAALLALPVSSFLLAGRAAHDVVSTAPAGDQALAAIGAGAGAALITGAATLFGLILGSIFCLTGLVLCLGGRREVVIVQAVEA